MKNITLSAPEEVIEAARKQAARKGTTLNVEFRRWLIKQSQLDKQDRGAQFDQLMQKSSHADSGGPFSREKLNER